MEPGTLPRTGKRLRHAFSTTQRGTLGQLVIHGDDFTLLGFEDDLNWFRDQISTRSEVKFKGRLGPGHDDEKAIRILNRVVYWTLDRIRYEPDQRHAEIIISKLDRCA